MDTLRGVILDDVRNDVSSLEKHLTPLMRQIGCTLKLNLWGCCCLFSFDESALRHGLESVKRKTNITSPKRYFCYTCNEFSKKNNLQTDYSFSGKLEKALESIQNQSNDISWTAEDHQSHENSNGQPLSSEYIHGSNNRGASQKKGYVDREAALAQAKWPEHMQLSFEPRGASYCREYSYPKWSLDPFYPWRAFPDTVEMLDAGYNLNDILDFYFAEAERWGSVALEFEYKMNNCPVASIPTYMQALLEYKQRESKMHELITEIPSPAERCSMDQPEHTVRNRLQSIKNASRQTISLEAI